MIIFVNLISEMVMLVMYWDDYMFSFWLICLLLFCFNVGEFIMFGLMNGEKLLLCVYLMVLLIWDEEIEFLLIKVEDGLFILCFQKIVFGDQVLLGKKLMGMLVVDVLLLGKCLFMLLMGIGFVLFMLVVCEFDIYDWFEQLVIVYLVCKVSDLVYYDMLEVWLVEDFLVSEQVVE